MGLERGYEIARFALGRAHRSLVDDAGGQPARAETDVVPIRPDYGGHVGSQRRRVSSPLSAG